MQTLPDTHWRRHPESGIPSYDPFELLTYWGEAGRNHPAELKRYELKGLFVIRRAIGEARIRAINRLKVLANDDESRTS